MPSAPLDTLQQLLDRARAQLDTGVRIAGADERERFHSWAEIEERSAAVAGGLARLGVAPGDRVGLIYPTSIDFLAALFGALQAAAVPVPLYPPVRFGRMAEYHARTAAMLDAVEARILLVDRRIRSLLGETLATLPPGALALGTHSLDELPRQSRFAATGSPDDLALVQFSSGTTVEPKPVALTQSAVLAQVRLLNAHWPDRAGLPGGRPTGVSWLPLYHDMGLIGCLFAALERPSVLTLLPPEAFVVRPALWLRAISRHRANVSTAPNFAYAFATERIADEELEGVDLSSWEVALCGAETVVPSVLRAFAARFARWGFRAEALTPVYGLSEAALAVTFPPLGRAFVSRWFDRQRLAVQGEAVEISLAVQGEPVELPLANQEETTAASHDDQDGATGEGAAASGAIEIASVGRPLAGFAIELRDERGARVAEGNVGRIWVRGPSLLRGYLHQPEATARALIGGWLDTGDLGFFKEGELYLTGRAKEMILLRGRNYAPVDLELALASVPEARAGCAVAVSHLPAGSATEEVLMFVEHRKGATAEEQVRLERATREAVLARTGIAVDRVFVLAPGTLPRTSSGKLRRGETLKRHLDRTLRPPGGTGAIQMAWILAKSRLKLLRGWK